MRSEDISGPGAALLGYDHETRLGSEVRLKNVVVDYAIPLVDMSCGPLCSRQI